MKLAGLVIGGVLIGLVLGSSIASHAYGPANQLAQDLTFILESGRCIWISPDTGARSPILTRR